MTRKELNAICASAYAEWITTEDGKEFLASPHDHCRGWEISEGAKRAFVTTYFDTQMNKVLIEKNGFSEDAEVKCLFQANRKTKTLTPAAWV